MLALEGSTQSRSHPAPLWISEKIEEEKARGFGFCLIYATAQNHDALIKELSKSDLEQQGIKVFPARGPDQVRLAQGNAQNMPIMLKWADRLVIEPKADAENTKKQAKGAPKKASKKAKKTA
ncbi:hypothetical protein [Microvirga tunisiensis]|uniref:Uncharacterized protein n=1 Tax=Microvirga tunisiensis TaxID=2108360 RepID=A0A5N7MBH2_9HYPH|nr:hypothetical protein [Microvirga tunisiensis]MPR06321.1 hypothetical protein [Microvirga tunisiensis]MPR24107.1 hypothetical protein [Microvirga tunisiensis]